MTYTRIPGATSEAFDGDGVEAPIRQVVRWPTAGDCFYVLFDDPHDALLEQWRISSTIQRIEPAHPSEHPNAPRSATSTPRRGPDLTPDGPVQRDSGVSPQQTAWPCRACRRSNSAASRDRGGLPVEFPRIGWWQPPLELTPYSGLTSWSSRLALQAIGATETSSQ